MSIKKSVKRSIIESLSLLIPDKLFLKIQFRRKMGYWMDFNNPRTYNEKLQWLKVYKRDPIMTQMVNKADAKKYVSRIIGEQHIIKTIGIWSSFDDINFDKLPDKFVLKTTHDSGGVVICTDKAKFDRKKAKFKLEKSLNRNYYAGTREWPYKDVPRQIIAEEYMIDESGYELKDYKWFCFSGEPKALFIASDRSSLTEETKFDFFDSDFNHLPFTNGHPNSSVEFIKPKGFEEMKEYARQLSQGFPHLRVDFYDINGKIYFGELTFYHWSGFVKFDPLEWDYIFGSWIKI